MQHRGFGVTNPHIALQLRHVFFGGRLLGERPRQHQFASKDRASWINATIEGSGHPFMDRMDPSLDVSNGAGRLSFEPSSIQVLGDRSQMDDQDNDLTVRQALEAVEFIDENGGGGGSAEHTKFQIINAPTD